MSELVTQAGREHDADWRNLLRIIDVAITDYGEYRGPVIPGIELLIKARKLLTGAIPAQQPSLAIEAEAAARATSELREAVTFVRDWAVDAQGTLYGPPFDPMLYGFDQIAQHCERALAATPASGTPASGEHEWTGAVPIGDNGEDWHAHSGLGWHAHPKGADHAAQRHDEGEGAR